MGLFSSSRSSSTTNNEENNFNNVDNRLAEGEGAIFGGNISLNSAGDLSEVNITQTDLGALDAAKTIASDALSSANSSISNALGIAAKAAEDDSSETLKYLVIGLSVVGVSFAVFAFRK